MKTAASGAGAALLWVPVVSSQVGFPTLVIMLFLFRLTLHFRLDAMSQEIKAGKAKVSSPGPPVYLPLISCVSFHPRSDRDGSLQL